MIVFTLYEIEHVELGRQVLVEEMLLLVVE